MATPTISMAKAINEAICQEMRRDPTVILLGEDVAGARGRDVAGPVGAWRSDRGAGGPDERQRDMVRGHPDSNR